MATIVDQVSQLLKENGYTFSDMMREFGANNTSLVNLSSDLQNKFNQYYDQLISGDCQKHTKGQLLENLTELLFNSELFCVRKNCRTSTNEIDILVDWSEKSRLFSLNSAYPCFGDLVLCECKNYNKPVDVTYIGKFASLLCVTKATIGIMVSWEGITGPKWQNGCGLIKKIALSEKREIIVIDKDDLKEIRNGNSNLLNIVHKKHMALITDIDYQKYIQKHEAEEGLIS